VKINKYKVAAIILTHNESIHISRCIKNIKGAVDIIFVVDSGSDDDTCEKAYALGATVLTRQPFINHSDQFNWALSKIGDDIDWVLRIDADEIINSKLHEEIITRVPSLSSEVVGISVSRRISFLGKSIQWGGIFPIKVIRLFRLGMGHCEKRWMDEHIIVDGKIVELSGEILDDNLKSISWWIDKHNGYASREAIDLLNLSYGFMKHDELAVTSRYEHASIKRWIKENIYFRFPLGIRALMYFLYRIIFRLGFLDGSKGIAFHFLQGFWYRYLVDLKINEVRDYIEVNNVKPVEAIKIKLGIDISRMQS